MKSVQLTSIKSDHKQQDDGHFNKVGTVPWSLDWLSHFPLREASNVICSKLKNNVDASNLHNEPIINLPLKTSSKEKKGGSVKHSVGFMKRVAHMSLNDHKDILKILKKQERNRKVRKGKQPSRATGNSSSDSSKNSTSSVNKDWENWVILHSKLAMLAEDVKDIGKAVGVNVASFFGEN